MQAVVNAFWGALSAFVAFLPTLLGALLLLILGWIIAVLVGKLVHKLLTSLGFERAVEGSGAAEMFRGSRWTGSKVVAALFKWFVFLLFVVAAANILGMPQITALMNSIVLFIPSLIVAVAIVILGALLARMLASMVRASLAGSAVADAVVVSKIVEYAVIGIAFIAALNQIGVATVVINTLFIGIVAAISLALGLAFGLGGRAVAGKITESWYESGITGRSRQYEVRAEDREPKVRRSGGGGV